MSNNNMLSNMLSNMILPFFLSTVMFFGPAQFVSLLPGQARFVTIVTFDQVTAAVNTLPATPSFGSAVPTALSNRTTPSFGVALLKPSHLDYNQEVPFVLIDMVKVLLIVAVALGLLTLIVPDWVFTTIFEDTPSFNTKQIEMPLMNIEEESILVLLHWQDLQSFNTQTIEMPLINIEEESILVEEETIETKKEANTSNFVITRKRDSGCFIIATDNVNTVPTTETPLQTIQVDENELNSCISQQDQSIESLSESIQVDENELNSCISQQEESIETPLESKQVLLSQQKLSIETRLEEAEFELQHRSTLIKAKKALGKDLDDWMYATNTPIETLLEEAEFELQYQSTLIKTEKALGKELDDWMYATNAPIETLLEEAEFVLQYQSTLIKARKSKQKKLLEVDTLLETAKAAQKEIDACISQLFQ